MKWIGNHKKSYVLGWRNAGRKSTGGFEAYVPYKGHISEQDFIRFYNLEKTLFEKDITGDKIYQ